MQPTTDCRLGITAHNGAAPSLSVIVIALLIVFGSPKGAIADSTSDGLRAITDTADRICGIVATSGEYQSLKVQGDVNAQLNGLLKKLAGLGISGRAALDTEDYKGVLQSDLPSALRDIRDCKLKVFDTLQRKLLPDTSATGPRGEISSPNTEPILAPVAAPGSAGWSRDARTGCNIWNPSPRAAVTVSWSGGCLGGMASGQGILEWHAPDLFQRYDGELVNGRQEGHGIFTNEKGMHCDGDFRDDRLTGQAKCTWPNGASYEGDWVDWKPDGHGTITKVNGDSYTGPFVNGKENGRGVIKFANGARYYGEVVDGRISGNGTMTKPDGSSFTGNFANGEANGRGVLRFPNGAHYDGEVVDGRISGYGTMTKPDGSSFTGNFVNGRESGLGIVTTQDGRRIQVEFQDGQLVRR